MSTSAVLVRKFIKAAGADADFAGTQVAPGASLLWEVGSVQRIAVSFVPYTAADAVSTGTLDIQLVSVSPVADVNGQAQDDLISGSTTTTNLAIGLEVEYSVIGKESVAVRVTNTAGLAGAVAYCLIYIRPLS